MANQLTSSGLTVGSGTITNFIPAFGSNVISNGLVGFIGQNSSTHFNLNNPKGELYDFI